MSTMPPPPPSPYPPLPQQQGMNPWLKALIGCGIGCFVLIAIVMVGCGVAWYRVAKPLAEGAQRLEEQSKAGERLAADLGTLDQTFPPRIPEDASTAVLSDDDISRYLRIRTDLAGPVAGLHAAYLAAAPSPAELEKNPIAGILNMAGGVVGNIAAAMQARAGVLEAARAPLERESMGPTDFSRMVALVEWHFLQRPEAMPAGLPPRDRKDALQALAKIHLVQPWIDAKLPAGFQPSGRDRAQMIREVERAKELLAELEVKARQAIALDPATRAALEARRAELEALPTAGLVLLTTPLHEDPPFLDEARSHGHGASGSGAPESDVDVDPDASEAIEPAESTGPTGGTGATGGSGASGASGAPGG